MGIELKKKEERKKSTNWKPNHKGLLSGNGYTTSRINHMLYWLWWNVACHFFGMENSMTSCMHKTLYIHATLYMVRCSFDSAQLLNILDATIAANKRNQTVSIELHRRPWKNLVPFFAVQVVLEFSLRHRSTDLTTLGALLSGEKKRRVQCCLITKWKTAIQGN